MNIFKYLISRQILKVSYVLSVWEGLTVSIVPVFQLKHFGFPFLGKVEKCTLFFHLHVRANDVIFRSEELQDVDRI